MLRCYDVVTNLKFLQVELDWSLVHLNYSDRWFLLIHDAYFSGLDDIHVVREGGGGLNFYSGL